MTYEKDDIFLRWYDKKTELITKEKQINEQECKLMMFCFNIKEVDFVSCYQLFEDSDTTCFLEFENG